jgi:multicomponent Na+:H+ antiporter subunit C
MTPSLAFALAGAGLVVVGLNALILRRHLLRKILALNVMSSGVFLVLSGLARPAPGEPVDPVPHALVITGIVIAVAATALALTLMLRVQRETGRAELPAPRQESTADRAGR